MSNKNNKFLEVLLQVHGDQKSIKTDLKHVKKNLEKLTKDEHLLEERTARAEKDIQTFKTHIKAATVILVPIGSAIVSISAYMLRTMFGG